MTDIWGELWRRWDKGEVNPFALVTCFPDFIKKIRAEGDRLKKEGMEHYAIGVEYYEKIEAVKKWFDAEKYISDAGIRELEKILEDDA